MRHYGAHCAGSDPDMIVAIVTTVIAEFDKAQKESQAVLLGFRVS